MPPAATVADEGRGGSDVGPPSAVVGGIVPAGLLGLLGPEDMAEYEEPLETPSLRL